MKQMFIAKNIDIRKRLFEVKYILNQSMNIFVSFYMYMQTGWSPIVLKFMRLCKSGSIYIHSLFLSIYLNNSRYKII